MGHMQASEFEPPEPIVPIYAYRCRACGKEFHTLVRSGETPVCEACASADLERQLSLIAAPNKGGDAPAAMGACDAMGGCGAGVCPVFGEA
jgi:putative FmdB family regulatory protein